MGEYAGELPRKFISLHCLENESNELKNCNTEGTENFPEIPRTSEIESVIIEETWTYPAKSLAESQVAAAKDSAVKETEETNEERVIVASQEGLLSISDEGSEGLEKLLRDDFDSLSGQGLERIMEVDPSVLLELLDDSLVERGDERSNVVSVDKEMHRSRVDYILCSELKKKRIGNVSKRRL